jgi:hypothetical protein
LWPQARLARSGEAGFSLRYFGFLNGFSIIDRMEKHKLY